MKTIVISVGGSTIVQESVQVEFLSELKKTLEKSTHARFVIVVGGGKTCRTYQEAAKQAADVTDEDLDWIGIASTYLNAHLVRSVLGPLAHQSVVTDPTKKIATKKRVIIASGWKPGWSTDYVMVKLAQTYNAHLLVNMTNVDYVYDKNPKEFINAKKIEKASWKQLQALVGTDWKPGLNAPFDPIATKEAAKQKLTLAIIGPDVGNLELLIHGKHYQGTTIS